MGSGGAIKEKASVLPAAGRRAGQRSRKLKEGSSGGRLGTGARCRRGSPAPAQERSCPLRRRRVRSPSRPGIDSRSGAFRRACRGPGAHAWGMRSHTGARTPAGARMKRERSRALGSARQGRGRPVRPPLAAPPLRLSRTSRFLSLSLLFRASHCPALCPRHGHTSAPVTASCTWVCLAVAACHLRVPNYALRIQNRTHASASARARAACERALGGCAGARLGGSGALRS